MNLKAVVFLLVCSSLAYPADKGASLRKYDGKYLVVLKEGLAVGICENHETHAGSITDGYPSLPNKLQDGRAEYHRETRFIAVGLSGCGAVNPQPIHKGELVRVVRVVVSRGYYVAHIESLPHQVERGLGASAHQSEDVGRAGLAINTTSADEAEQTLDHWLKVFNGGRDVPAAQIGNTASGVFVKQIKLGMSVEEVEQVFGPPAVRADLGPKVLYKYKDMTVEFTDGKVSDVR